MNRSLRLTVGDVVQSILVLHDNDNWEGALKLLVSRLLILLIFLIPGSKGLRI